MQSERRPATMSRQNYHHVVAALGTLVPERHLRQALEDRALAPLSPSRVDQHRCMDVTGELSRRHGDALLLTRGFQRLQQEPRHFFPTLRKPPGDTLAVLMMFQRYISLHTELGEWDLRLGSPSRLCLNRNPGFQDSDAHALSLMFTCSQLLARSGLGRITGVTLRARPAAGDVAAIRDLFGVMPQFGADDDSLVFENAALLHDIGAQVPLACVGGYERFLRGTRPALNWSDSLRGLLPMVLGLPGTPLALCASLLAVGERTLQRRIEREGHTFSDLLRDSRRALAAQLLALPDLRTEHLAARLGYRQSAQFYRAFRDWFGESPGRIRAAG